MRLRVPGSFAAKDYRLTSAYWIRWWLYAHSGYVTEGGHVECKDDLAAYKATLRRMTRRSRADRHAEIARRSNTKRASKCYTMSVFGVLHKWGASFLLTVFNLQHPDQDRKSVV